MSAEIDPNAAAAEAATLLDALATERRAHTRTKARLDAALAANDALEVIAHDERAAADAARGQANRAEALLRRIHQTLAATQRALADLPLDGSDD